MTTPSWRTEMNQAIGKFLEIEGEILEVHEEISSGYGCETCGYDITVEVEVIYLQDGERKIHTWYGDFTTLLSKIT